MRLSRFETLLATCGLIDSSNAKSLWSTIPANGSDIIRTTYPLGNGRLGAMPIGPPGAETLTLNLDTLWSGGPFNASVSSADSVLVIGLQPTLTHQTELHGR